ncbi:LuxR family transcriptional regulator, maltose regulon positive regulatory protein [Solimonas aquatica]|uniref:LuxR family transcriptional regulator, maltose regulon positive regulatory protein n=2 Tax=Solimonas aquatica TaxID=489703 RepID=A0A1H9HEA1_9GAMM|nr:LuxR family transcriptional regulator, maltose regulon positive regulatory protein [Solimonas aquatica]
MAAESLRRTERLIATKLKAIACDPRSVSRRQLFAQQLSLGGSARVLTVVAPAGSGKSTVLAQLHQALREQNVATCWLSLDAADDDPATFALYFLSALISARGDAMAPQLAMLRANPIQKLRPVFASLLAELSALSEPLAVFLDDFQHLHNPVLLGFFNDLLAHLPDSLQLVFASRSQLPLDLARLRAAGALCEIRQAELNFDREQAAAFLQRYHGIRLSSANLDGLLAGTEGWPTAIQLVALALLRHPGPPGELIGSFCGRDKDLTEYLVQSVLRAQPAEITGFLLHTSVLRRLSPGLCEAVAGHRRSAAMLEELERANLFLIPLDRESQWYRYHHLFAEFLQARFRRQDPEGYRSACHRAAQYCEQQGEVTEAIQYFLDAESYEQAVTLIARHGRLVSHHQGDHYSILEWMRRLPAAYHEARPEIVLCHAWSRTFCRDSGSALRMLDALRQRLADRERCWPMDEAEHTRIDRWARVVQLVAAAASDQIEQAATHAPQLLRELGEDELMLLATTSNVLSYVTLVRREFERCKQVAEQSYRQALRAEAPYAANWADFINGMAHIENGQLRTAGSFSARILTHAPQMELKPYSRGLAVALDTDIALQRCDFEGAQKLIDSMGAFREVFGPAEPLWMTIRAEAWLKLWDGDRAGARQALQNGQDVALRTQQPRLYTSLAIEEAQLCAVVGDAACALEVVRRAQLSQDNAALREYGNARVLRNQLQLLEARLRIAENEHASAVRLLTSLLQSRGAETRGGFWLSVTAARAVALWGARQQRDAARELDRALDAAADEFHAFPLAATGQMLLPVLDAIGQRRPGSHEAAGDLQAKLKLQLWLTAFLRGEQAAPVEEAAPAESVSRLETLTAREVQLLRLVQSGLNNRSLADALLVSETTVKWHLHNVYTKLAVRSRGAAVAKAREYGLI